MIAAFLHGLESVFAWLLEATWQASVLAALVLLLQRALRGRLNPRWHHALWLLVVARLLLPVLPESALSLFQFALMPSPLVEQTITEPIFSSAPQAPEATAPTTPVPLPPYPFSAFTILAVVWLTGAVGLLLLTWYVNRRYARHVLTAPAITDTRLLQLAEAARQELGIRRSLRMIESGQVQSPAIIGLLRPTLILPKDVRARFDDDELRFIFLHEFAHLKRGDLVLQWLVALLQIIHWFNPMLWYAFRRMRADREPATDALVLSCAGEVHKESYGQVLVKLLQHYHQRHSLPTLVGILEDKDQFKRRFSLIAHFTRGAYGWSMMGVLLIGVLSIACLTKSKAAATTPVSASQSADVTKNNPALMIRLNLQVVQIDDDDYQAHRPEIDAAVLQGDAQPFLHLKSYRPVMVNPILTKAGQQCVIENVRVMPYAVPPGKDSNGNALPTKYTRRNLGVRFVSIPSFTDGKVNVSGRLEITRLSGWIPQGDNYQEPLFNVTGTTISEAFVPGQTRGHAISAGAPVGYSDPDFYFTSDKPPDPSQNPQVARRIFFFLSTQVFHDDGKPVTELLTDNAPAGTSTTTQRLTVRTFLAPTGFFKTIPADHADIRPELIAHGIAFPANTTAIYLSIGTIDLATAGKIVVRNTPEQLDKIYTLIESFTDATAIPKTDPASAQNSNLLQSQYAKAKATPTGTNENSTSSRIEKQGSSGTSKISPLILNFTLVEVTEKAYAAQTEAMNAAVANRDLEFFKQQKGTFVGPPIEATYDTTKGWYSQGEVQSYVASATYHQPNGNQFVQLTAKAFFLGINADFVFSPSPNATSLHADWQITEPEKAHGTDAPPADTAKSLPNTFSVGPIFHVAKFEDKNWTIVPGKLYAYWLGKTFGQFTRTAGFRDLSHASIDEMAANKVPSRLAVFIQASMSDPVAPLTFANAQDPDVKVKKYLEVTFIETPGAMNGAGEGPLSPDEVAKLLGSPNSKASVLGSVEVQDGPISIKGKTPAGFDYAITGDWKTSVVGPQKIDMRIDENSNQGFRRAWETKDGLSEEQSLVVSESWKPASRANLLIQLVNHPGSANSRTESDIQSPDPKAASMSGTQAQLVLTLRDRAKSMPSDYQHLQILQGFYGADGSWRDVTGILQKSVKNDSLKVLWQQPYTEIGGDPAYLEVKTLIVSYRLDGVEKLATFREENPPVGLQATIPTKN